MHFILFYFLFYLVSRDKTLSFILATQDSAKWDAGAGPGSNPSISYTYREKKVSVELYCSNTTTAEFEAIGESPINVFKFRLTHKCACWNGCGGKQLTIHFSMTHMIKIRSHSYVFYESLLKLAHKNEVEINSNDIDYEKHAK